MATMQDVARRAGVAVSTVSYAISGSRSISPETVERVRAAMEELDYRPNAAARSLASRRSRMLAMHLAAFDATVGDTVFEIARGARARAADHGYHLTIWPLPDDQAPHELVSLVSQGHADGVLLLEVALEDARIDALQRAGIPTVAVGRPRQPDAVDHVDIDFAGTVDGAVADLIAAGRRDLLLIGRSDAEHAAGYGPTIRTQRAFLEAVERSGAIGRVLTCDASPQAGRQLLRELIAESGTESRVPDGVVVMNDMAVLGLVDELHAQGLSIPGDVAVTTIVSSSRTSTMTTPSLAGWSAPGEEMGALAVETLLQRIESGADAPIRHHLVSCSRIPGASIPSSVSHPASPTARPAGTDTP